MTELNQLTTEELLNLYPIVKELRKQVLEIVQKHGYSAEQLMSKTFEHDIERWYGKRVLESVDVLEKENV